MPIRYSQIESLLDGNYGTQYNQTHHNHQNIMVHLSSLYFRQNDFIDLMKYLSNVLLRLCVSWTKSTYKCPLVFLQKNSLIVEPLESCLESQHGFQMFFKEPTHNLLRYVLSTKPMIVHISQTTFLTMILSNQFQYRISIRFKFNVSSYVNPRFKINCIRY